MGGSVVVVMPAYNEAGGISEFLSELSAHLGADAQYVVVDDESSDGTADVVQACAQSGMPVEVLRNDRNLGHGPSTVRALKAGLERGPHLVVAIDGDGQFLGEDVKRLVDLARTGDAAVLEGVRTHRDGPLFRRVTSAATRMLVRSRAGISPMDANTPLRVYEPATLASLLQGVPDDAMTPNLLISALTRRWGLAVSEVSVRSISRRGGDQAGSTWRAKHQRLPSRRFLRFCAKAGVQWLAYGRTEK